MKNLCFLSLCGIDILEECLFLYLLSYKELELEDKINIKTKQKVLTMGGDEGVRNVQKYQREHEGSRRQEEAQRAGEETPGHAGLRSHTGFSDGADQR